MEQYINVLLALMIIGSFLVAVALHECGHALMAYWLGDRTPANEGRLTLSIRPHLDPLGTLLCVILAFQPILLIPTGLGWGKPVKPDPWKLRFGPDKGVFLVAIAGPLFNLLIGLLVALIIRVIYLALPLDVFTVRSLQLLVVFASINISLTLFNLIPLYPLDGYQILYTLLPSKQAVQFSKSAPYGPFIILILFFFLPFLAQLARVGDFPLFHLPRYIWLGSLSLMAPLAGLSSRFDQGLQMLMRFYVN
jgi:Zn-dependent protease